MSEPTGWSPIRGAVKRHMFWQDYEGMVRSNCGRVFASALPNGPVPARLEGPICERCFDIDAGAHRSTIPVIVDPDYRKKYFPDGD